MWLILLAACGPRAQPPVPAVSPAAPVAVPSVCEQLGALLERVGTELRADVGTKLGTLTDADGSRPGQLDGVVVYGVPEACLAPERLGSDVERHVTCTFAAEPSRAWWLVEVQQTEQTLQRVAGGGCDHAPELQECDPEKDAWGVDGRPRVTREVLVVSGTPQGDAVELRTRVALRAEVDLWQLARGEQGWVVQAAAGGDTCVFALPER